MEKKSYKTPAIQLNTLSYQSIICVSGGGDTSTAYGGKTSENPGIEPGAKSRDNGTWNSLW